MENFEYTIEYSLHFITENLKNKGKIFVGFSGGKDSIVTADLMKRSGIPFQLYYSVTGIDPPEVVKFIRKNYPECIFLRPKYTFWHYLLTKNPPANFHRWCCRELKKVPSAKIPLRHRVMGIRAEEGSRRSKYDLITYIHTLDVFHYSPILYWKELDVWDYIEDRNLLYPDLYDQGLSRLGCVICPFHSTGKGAGHNFYRQRWPKFFERFEKYCLIWFEKRKNQGRKMFFDTPDEFIAEWYKGNVQWYARKTDQMCFDDFGV